MQSTNADLKQAGLKVTLPRVKILKLLEDHQDSHLSAEDVYKLLAEAGEDVGLATVYRVLTQFETAGLVEKHNFDANYAVYELASEDHHDHMVDVDTGEVVEFFSAELENLKQQIAEDNGYTLEDHALVLYVKKKP